MEQRYTVQRAFGVSRYTGRIVAEGWDLLHGDEWCQRFNTKREAIAALRQCENNQLTQVQE